MLALHPLSTFALSIKNSHYNPKTDVFTKKPHLTFLPPYYSFTTSRPLFKPNRGR